MRYLSIGILLTVLALPPIAVTAAGVVCWVPLFWLAGREPSARAAFYGACYGFVIGSYVFFGALAYSAVVYFLTVVALSALFGAFLWLTSGLLNRGSHRRGLGSPFQIAIVWVFAEMVCEILRLPFTSVLALTQTPALLQTADLGGQYLLSFLFVMFQASVAMALGQLSVRERLTHFSAAGLVVALVGGYAAFTDHAAWRISAGRLYAAVVQTDVHPALTENWKADGQLQTLARIRGESIALLGGLDPKPELVVWPEVWFAGLEMRRGTLALGPVVGAAMLVGAPDSDEFGRRINAVFSVSAKGDVLHRHEKKILLPLLEDEYAGASAPEPHRQIAGVPGSLICFESAFPSVARKLTQAGAKSLAISTSDAYAGPSFLALMHHELARIRAVENRRAVLRAANGGPSSIIEPSGEILDRLDLFEGGILAQQVPLVTHLTFYTRYGNWWTLAWLGLLSLPAWGLWQNRHSRPRPPLASSLRGTGLMALLAALSLCAFQIGYATSAYHAARPGSHKAVYSPAFRVEVDGIEWTYEQLTVSAQDRTQYAAFGYLLREHGVPVSLDALLALAGTLQEHGVSAVGLQELAEHFGFGVSIREFPGKTFSLPTPALVELRSGETVVLQKLEPSRASLFSPLRGQHVAIKREAFMETWRGATLRLVDLAAENDEPTESFRPLQ